MEYVICIFVSAVLSSIYTNIRLNQMNELNSEYMKKFSEATFDGIIQVLKKCGIIE